MSYSNKRKVRLVDAVIPASGTDSALVDIKDLSVLGVYFPAALTGASITFKASKDGGLIASAVTVQALPTNGGAQSNFVLNKAVSTYVPLDPALLAGVQYLYVVSASAEGAERSITLACREL